MIGTKVERAGIIRAGAKMISAVSEATVPRICVVVRKAYGAGLYAMDGPGFGPSATLALPQAMIAVMGPEAAVNAVYFNKIQEQPEAERAAYVAAAPRRVPARHRPREARRRARRGRGRPGRRLRDELVRRFRFYCRVLRAAARAEARVCRPYDVRPAGVAPGDPADGPRVLRGRGEASRAPLGRRGALPARHGRGSSASWGSSGSSCRRSTAARGSTRSPSRSSSRRSRVTTARSHSPWRRTTASERATSSRSGPSRRSADGCRTSRAGGSSRRGGSPSRGPGRTPRRCARPRCGRATAGS